MEPDILHGDRVTLRPATAEDLPAFLGIVHEPSVARWWGSHDDDRLAEELLATGSVTFAIEHHGRVIGWIQYSEQPDESYRYAGMDISVAEAWQGRGLGTDALRTLARHLFEERGHHRLTIDPALDNERAIRTYARLGFRPVGVMREYERRDGAWRDSLLMDMLRRELEVPGE
jgi:aminoglycoside 6'-N-acetyltransferase